MLDCVLERNDQGLYQCVRDDCGWVYPVKTQGPPPRHTCRALRRQTTPAPNPRSLVGSTLHDKLLETLGAGFETGCACKEWIIKMNKWGPAGCRENLGTIVNALLAEAKRRNWHFGDRPLLSKVSQLGAAVPWGMTVARAVTRSIVMRAIREVEKWQESVGPTV